MSNIAIRISHVDRVLIATMHSAKNVNMVTPNFMRELLTLAIEADPVREISHQIWGAGSCSGVDF
jgi:hypothetical protein